MVRAVGGDRAEHLGDRSQAALACRVRALDQHSRRAHPQDEAVTAPIEGQGGVFEHLVGSRCAAREKARTDPLQEVVAGHVVGGHDDDTPATPAQDPVLGERHGLGATGTRRVDLGVRTAGADVLGELRVSHGHHLEQEPTVELVCVALEVTLQLLDSTVELGRKRVIATVGSHPRAQVA